MIPGPPPADARPSSPWRLAGRAPRLRVLMVASEVSPWAKTGGLADVLAGLPAALDDLGHDTTIVLPRYRGMALPASDITTHPVSVGAQTFEVQFHAATISPRQRVVFVDSPSHFDRDGFYSNGGRDFVDNAERFALLSTAALDFVQRDPADPPYLIHAHDWQAGLVPVLLRSQPKRWPRIASAGLVFTIHNIAYQGVFPRETVPALGLPWDVFRVEGGEFWGRFSFLKAGITYSDLVTTVSPTYARETQTAEFGAGFEGVLASRADCYLGILNGIDTRTWDPASDEWLPARFTAEQLEGKAVCKRALLERFHLPLGDDALSRPLIGMVSRLVEQKGLDLILDAADALVGLEANWVFVGTGDRRFEEGLRALAARHPARVGVFIGFDEGLAHLVEAGADMFLMPSKFEPCGLNQMYSLRYGTVPIVRAVGGLDDTVQPYTPRALKATGFKFREASSEVLVRTVRQAVRTYQDQPVWRRLQKQGMAEDHSWEISAREYVKVYRRARFHAAVRAASAVPGERKG